MKTVLVGSLVTIFSFAHFTLSYPLKAQDESLENTRFLDNLAIVIGDNNSGNGTNSGTSGLGNNNGNNNGNNSGNKQCLGCYGSYNPGPHDGPGKIYYIEKK